MAPKIIYIAVLNGLITERNLVELDIQLFEVEIKERSKSDVLKCVNI